MYLKKYSRRVFKLWNRLPKEVAELPLLEVFKKCVDVAPGEWTNGGLGSVGLNC